MSKSSTDFTAIGKAVKTHGLDGGLKIYPLTDNVNRFKKLKSCFIGEEKKELHMIRASVKGNMVIIHFEEIPTIEEAQKYINFFLYVRDEDRVKLPENHYFIHDLIGSEVFYDSEMIGTVCDVYTGLANDCYVVDDGKKQFLIPSVKEFILRVDIANKRIDVKLIEGMRE